MAKANVQTKEVNVVETKGATMNNRTYSRDYTLYLIDNAYAGKPEVSIKTRVLTTFMTEVKDENGEPIKDKNDNPIMKEIKGSLDVVTMLLKQGIITGFEVETEVGEDGKLNYVINLKGFDPSVESKKSKANGGGTFRWFNGLYQKDKYAKKISA